MNLTFNNTVPAANNDPSADQSPMLINNVSTNSWVNIDHHGFGDNIGGYHRNIRQDTATPVQKTVNRVTGTSTGIPGSIPGINQFFAANVVVPANPGPGTSTDTQLFSVTGGQAPGQFSQLTGNLSSVEGYVWCSGVLIQWGTISGSAYTTPAAVIFASRAGCIKFPSSCFVVTVTLIGNNVSPASDNTVWILGKSATQFTWRKSSTATAYTGFNWIAIGN